MPRSHGQSGYRTLPCEFLAELNIFWSALTCAADKHVVRFGPLQTMACSLGMTRAEVHAGKLSMMPSSSPSNRSHADKTACEARSRSSSVKVLFRNG